ncbi:Dihydroorotate dehydrogenase (quinone) [Tumidithrix helvetica PCC 7403]|uniref:quinone-dependent dihydroorotate dehydrogenase n=1 Tax=Tumidithrix helvetica TaxID=3457545 RepID=UPI003C983FC6
MLSQVYQYGLRPWLFALDPEMAHRLAIAACQKVSELTPLQAIVRAACQYQHPCLQQNLWGIQFPNPIGLGAGFDKDAVGIGAWASFGFGFAEVGTITAHAQTGNPKPRLFRLPADLAILNRMGFNNRGAAPTAAYLAEYFDRQDSRTKSTVPLGINLGKSKITALQDAKDDYLQSFRLLKQFGDYFVVNVSSPNTVGLRDLQAADQLGGILAALQSENDRALPILVKIAPDLNDADIHAIAAVCQSNQVAGIVATNTTISRQDLKTSITPITGKAIADEAGGISGKPLQQRSTEVIRLVWQATEGKMPIVGVGGIFTAEDAWQKIIAGASLLQIYTSWVYQGPLVVREILSGLVQKLEAEGLEQISQAVGLAHREIKQHS